jgi:hypothetical protein
MSWDRSIAAAGMVEVLQAALGETATVFEHPPATFNPPALMVGYPVTVTFNTSFCVDTADWIVTAAAGIDDPSTVDNLIALARQAIEANLNLGGAVQICRPSGARNWRGWTVAGGEYLLADLALETRM